MITTNKKPRWVQRMTQNHKNSRMPFNDRFALDYMGNSYFEQGKLVETIRTLAAQPELGLLEFKIDKVRIYVAFNPSNYTAEAAETIIRAIWNREHWMEEHTGFDEKHYNMRKSDRWQEADAWIDIESGLFWTWERINLQDMHRTYQTHVQYLDYQRTRIDAGHERLDPRDFNYKIHLPYERKAEGVESGN